MSNKERLTQNGAIVIDDGLAVYFHGEKFVMMGDWYKAEQGEVIKIGIREAIMLRDHINLFLYKTVGEPT